MLFSYRSDLDKIKNYYTDTRHIINKRIDEVQIVGAVYGNYRFSKERMANKVGQRFIWQVPVLNTIVAGLNQPLIENDINYPHPFDTNKPREGIYFGVRVRGNSMKEANILTRQLALIRQQATAANRDIAAVTISIRNLPKPITVLKEFYFEERAGIRHWCLKSRHPSVEHLVVIPEDTHAAKIKSLYSGRLQSERYRFIEDAELQIAGKFIQILPE